MLIAGAALGAAAGAIPGLTGANKSSYEYAKPLSELSNYQYNGYGQKDMRDRGDASATRTAAQANYANANQSRNQNLSARVDQANATGLYQAAAEGRGPSVAGSLMQQGISDSTRAQMAVANSMRGGGAQRGAMLSQALSQGSNANQAAANQAAQLRAQEMQQAMAGYANASGQLRQGDAALMGQDAQMAQYQASLDQQQRSQNDAMQMGYERLGAQASEDQQKGRSMWAERDAQDILATQQGNAHIEEFNAGGAGKNADSVVGGAMGGAMGALKLSDRRAKTDIHPGDAQLSSFLDHIDAHSYRYKGDESRTPQLGPMAQEMEQTPIGRTLVSRDDQGMRRVNYEAAAPLMLSGLAMLHERLNRIEGKGERK